MVYLYLTKQWACGTRIVAFDARKIYPLVQFKEFVEILRFNESHRTMGINLMIRDDTIINFP